MKTAWLGLQPGRFTRRTLCSGWFVGPEIDSESAKASRRGLLRSTGEDLVSPGDLEPLETGRFDYRLELCFQQSAGDSALPQIDILLGSVRHGFLHHDVADL